MRARSVSVLSAGVAVAALIAGGAHAGSFALKERSAKAQGLSFAGATAGSGGIQSMGFNPAIVTTVDEGTVLSGGISFIQPVADGVVTATGQNVDADRFAGITNGYVAHRLDPDLWIGMSVFTPFGLVTSYPANWAGAGDALTSKLQTIQFSPTIGFQPFEDISFGFSGNILYSNARLTSAALILQGDSVDFGFTVGVLWEPTDSTTIGLTYDHGYDLELPGTGTFGPAAAANPALVPLLGIPLAAEAKAGLPATISMGIIQDITEDVRVMAELQYQMWSSFDSIDVSVLSPVGAINQSDAQNYEDVLFIAAGAEYDVSDALTLRMGAAWDQTPTVDGIDGRTARVPDEDRIWLSLGASYDMNDHMTLDLGYSYLFALEDPVVTIRTGPAAGTTVVYDGGAHILSIGSTLRF